MSQETISAVVSNMIDIHSDDGSGDSIASKEPIWDDEFSQKFPELFRDDVSIYPSYTRFTIPYPVKCRDRYRQARRQYCKQLLKEALALELQQQRAIDGVRMLRVMAVGIQPPRRAFKELSREDRRHIEDLLSTRKLFKDEHEQI